MLVSTLVQKLSNHLYLASKGIDDELQAGRIDSFDTFLDDMVAILVFDALEHVAFQFGYDQFLLIQWDTLQGLLDHPTAIHLQGQGLDVGPELKISELLTENMCNTRLAK